MQCCNKMNTELRDDECCSRSPEVGAAAGGRASGGRQSKSSVALTTVMPC